MGRIAQAMYGGGAPQETPRPRPQVPGTVNPRMDVLKDLKKKERRRYSTMRDAASIAALERTP